MKNLISFILICSLIACKKETEEPTKLFKPVYQRYMTSVVNHDTAMGVRSTFEVKNLGGNGSTLKGVWLAAYINTSTGQRPWIQLGYHQWGGPSMFSMMFFSTARGTQLNTWPVLQSGTIHSFHIRVENGNVFTGVDNQDYAVVPLDAVSIATKHITFESEGTDNKAPSMPTVRFYPALEVYNGSWSGVTSAYSTGSGYGVQLNATNDVSIGSSIKTKPGIQLW